MQRKVMTIGVVACVLALMFGGLSLAQQGQRGQRGPGGQGGDQGGRQFEPGQRGQFDPAQMRQRMTERMKEQLGVSDAEWKVFEPRLTRVMELSRQGAGAGPGAMMGMMRGRGGPGGDQGGPGGDRRGPQGTQTGLQKAMTQLQQTLENQSASPEEIKKQLTTVRQERVKAQQELAVARSELQKICTPRQEAQLVIMGMLE